MAIDTEDENLYTVNLSNKRLHRLPLGDGQTGQSTLIPDPGCANGDWRPFAAAFDRVNERLYVGGVCSAETSQDRANLRAVVYRVDSPESSPTFQPVLDFPLNYERSRSPAPLSWRPRLTYCAQPKLLPLESVAHGRLDWREIAR